MIISTGRTGKSEMIFPTSRAARQMRNEFTYVPGRADKREIIFPRGQNNNNNNKILRVNTGRLNKEEIFKPTEKIVMYRT